MGVQSAVQNGTVGIFLAYSVEIINSNKDDQIKCLSMSPVPVDGDVTKEFGARDGSNADLVACS